MRIFGIISLSLLVAGTIVQFVALLSTHDSDQSLVMVGWMLLGLHTIGVGSPIVSLRFVATKKPRMAGVIAIALSVPGILLWIYFLMNHELARIDGSLVILLFLASAIALFIGGILSLREDLQAKAAIEPKQEKIPEPQNKPALRSGVYSKPRSKL
ncbi:MAG: hypothetical protein HXX08_22625 [Chloroflexi bacterium]|uniref:Uncharacterized protein n=1 Tax=Candidatus Chlorohelix allophototropha TaxID=3003348 RepID=A0A8T7M965_9CHLR|nr:hypothetical protein [Chloroflexota bacterium]WJW68595.1 hypothetical protein OZ401_004209 [Chloroflexota bacterium L227-S17]